jgi:hypothetical protein
VEVERIELSTHACKAHVFPLAPHPHNNLVGVQGFEPWTPWSQTRCATRLRYTPIKTGCLAWARTTDILINSQAQLPTVLLGNKTGAGDEVRTRDILLGKQALYQLRYSRITINYTYTLFVCQWYLVGESNSRLRCVKAVFYH